MEIALILIAYLFGSLSSAVLVCRLWGLGDPREQGSKNPGATNVLRMGGKIPAVCTLIGDVLKGVFPVLLAITLSEKSSVIGCVMLATVLGHLYPVFFKFQGGKGVATVIGVITTLYWPLGVLFVSIWLATTLCFRISSLSALVATLAMPFFTTYYLGKDYGMITGILAILLFIRHRKNIVRLLNGQEPRLTKRK